MTTSAHNPRPFAQTVGPATSDSSDLRPLLRFVAAALPVGWVLLSVPLFLDAPFAPFVLGTLYLGLVLPTVLLTRRRPRRLDASAAARHLPAASPGLVAGPGSAADPGRYLRLGCALGHEVDLTSGFVLNLAVANVLSSVLI